jgi:hypothetical protein
MGINTPEAQNPADDGINTHEARNPAEITEYADTARCIGDVRVIRRNPRFGGGDP